MLMLAQVEVGVLESLAREGGPFAVAFAMLVVGAILLWRYAIKPIVDSLAKMHGTAATCAASHAEASRNNLEASRHNEAAADTNKLAAQQNSQLAERLLDKLTETHK